MNAIIDSVTVANACRDNAIGIRGVCSTAYTFYLDTLGVSLRKAAALADSSKITGKALVEEAVDQAWSMVFSDLKVQGFKVQGVTRKLDTELGTETGTASSYTTTLTRGCDYEQFVFNKVKLKADGSTDLVVTLTYGDTELELFDDTLNDETLTITVDSTFAEEEIILTVTNTGTLYLTPEGHPFEYDAYLECSENLFYCKYWKTLAPAVMYKAAALILNNSLFNDRYNDIVAYGRDEIAIKVSQLDSSLNLLNNENRINKYGLYQQEIDKINDKLKLIAYDCLCNSCCFECHEYVSTKITIP